MVVADEFASHVRSRPSFWVWFNHHQSNAHPAESDTHSHTHTTHTHAHTNKQKQQHTHKMLKRTVIKVICYDTVRAHKQSDGHSCALVQSLTSSHGRVTSWPWERAFVDALMFMFWRLAMMKESLFKSGLEGPPLNAPPFSPYNCTHALPGSYARTRKTHVKVCSQI